MIKPGEKALRFLSWEVGMFFHFGIRSFYPGHRDWDGLEMPAEGFQPRELDCGEWMRAAKLIGAKYAIMTTKHHDGFALWPSRYTSYSVAASSWRDGKGDVVKEFTDACRENGLKVGLYYSPAQWGATAVNFENGKEYDDYFINQITELLTGYGKIDYLWFDGCGSDGHEYDQKRIIRVIRSLQPDILIFGMWDPDTVWVGNEDGYAHEPNLYGKDRVILGEMKHAFLPDECDCKLRRSWFYDHNEETIKTVDELIGMYEYSVGRGCNLLLNVGPDDRGRIANADLTRLNELRAELIRRYGAPKEFEEITRVDPATYTASITPRRAAELIDSERLPLCTSVVLKEDIRDGQKVLGFKLYAHMPSLYPAREDKMCVFEGETIGHKRICRFPAIRTSKFTLVLTQTDGEAVIEDFRVY